MDPKFTQTAAQFAALVGELGPDAEHRAQLAVDEDGSISATWLANRKELTLSVCPDGSGFILATNEDDLILIDEEFSITYSPISRDALFEANQFLMSLEPRLASSAH